MASFILILFKKNIIRNANHLNRSCCCVLVLQGFYSTFLSFVALYIRATRPAPFQFESGR